MLNKLKQNKAKFVTILVLLLALAVRIYGINWDEGHSLHPDERALIMATIPLSSSNLNPDFYNYGHLPIYMLKATSSIFGLSDPSYSGYPGILVVGRMLSALFDTFTVAMVYLFGKKLRDKRLGLLAGFIYAISVFPIQNAHFFIVDPFLNFWLVANLLVATYAVEKPTFKRMALMGALCGLAAATKFTGILSVSIPLIVLLISFVQHLRGHTLNAKEFMRLAGLGVSVLTAAVLMFFITQPYVLLNLATFWDKISLQLTMNSNPSIFPYTIQFINTTPYLHPLLGIFVWGLGTPLGITCVLGLIFAVYQTYKTRDLKLLTLLLFGALFFGVLGRSAVKYMRYYLPLYPLLAIFGGLALMKLFDLLKKQRAIRSVVVFITLTTISVWTVMFMQIYTHPNTRIAATDWINENLPSYSTILTEHWDDVVPLINEGGFNIQQLSVYDPESNTKWNRINAQLKDADFLVISSKRVYKSILHNPQKYPITSQFYEDLFAGRTQYTLYKEFESYPKLSIGPWYISVNDGDAPESFTIFDHPKVWIFANNANRD